jgi:tetratricopeptide (TPR) repeat protein
MSDYLCRRTFLTGIAALAAGCAQPQQPERRTGKDGYEHMLALYRQGKTFEAISLLDKLIDDEPGNAPLYNDRGALRATRGEWGHALRDFNLSIALDPAALRPYVGRGKVYRVLANSWHAADPAKSKDYRQKAIADFEAAAARDQTSVLAHLHLGLLYYESGEDQKAYDALDKGFKFLRQQPGARERLDGGLEDGCRERYEKLLKNRRA